MASPDIPAPDRVSNPSESPPMYLYRDLLAAAWMAKHHGFLFETNRIGFTYCGKTKKLVPDSTPDVLSIVLDVFDVQADDDVVKHFISPKYYIHPDSLRLLGPQEGDLVAIDAFPGAFMAHHENIVMFDADGDPSEARRIIQGNGLAFHWPESEPA
jgi:hypothetical protein